MISPPSATSSILIGLSLALFTGCDTGLKTYPAGGIVKYKDGSPIQPLVGGSVIFDCAAEKVSAKGTIQPDGSFTLRTYKKDGAAAGAHRAMIQPPPVGMNPDNAPADVVARRYRRFKSSGFVFEVTPDADKNQFVLGVEQP